MKSQAQKTLVCKEKISGCARIQNIEYSFILGTSGFEDLKTSVQFWKTIWESRWHCLSTGIGIGLVCVCTCFGYPILSDEARRHTKLMGNSQVVEGYIRRHDRLPNCRRGSEYPLTRPCFSSLAYLRPVPQFDQIDRVHRLESWTKSR